MDFFALLSPSDTGGFVICDSCISLLAQASVTVKRNKSQTEEENENNFTPAPVQLVSPKEIYQHLDNYIIGQTEAKKSIAVAVYQHYQRINNPELKRKSNIMIVGPTGSGKTEIARTIAQLLNVPFAQVDVTTMTPRGYVGDNPEICIEKLLMAANGNVKEAERGIIFLDEFDKIPSGVEHGSFKAKAVQQELLKLIEGSKVDINKPGAEQGAPKVSVDTSKVLFISAGSFAGIEEFLNKENQKVMGFGGNVEPENSTEIKRPELKHFISFGLIPEILGRFPVVCFTNELTKDELCRVLSEPKDSVLEHYQTLFKVAGVNLEVTKDCLNDLVEKAVAEKLGARGLAKQLELKLQPLLFDIDSFHGKTLVVDVNGHYAESDTLKAEA